MDATYGRIAVTGANGFLGRHVVVTLKSRGVNVLEIVRPSAVTDQSRQAGFDLQDLKPGLPVLTGIETVIHCAARVHINRKRSRNDDAEHVKQNFEAVRHVARQAAANGVSHFVLVSTVAVYGISSHADVIADTHPLNPQTAYGKAKLAAEQALHEIASRTGMTYTIVRLPVLLGPDAPGNMQSLLKLLRTQVPLPLAAIKNRRTIVDVVNAADFIAHSVKSPELRNQIVLFTHQLEMSTPDLIRKLAQAHGLPCRMFAIPPTLLRMSLNNMGLSHMSDQLFGNLVFQPSDTVLNSGWQANAR